MPNQDRFSLTRERVKKIVKKVVEQDLRTSH